MPSVNRVIIAGNLVRDPELRQLTSGTSVCEIDVAINERVKKEGQWVEDVVFVSCTLWARTAEVAAQYLGKGSPVLIEGRLKLDQWEKDGQKRSKLRVVADKMQMLGGKSGGKPADDSDEYGSIGADGVTLPANSPPPEDDIPF